MLSNCSFQCHEYWQQYWWLCLHRDAIKLCPDFLHFESWRVKQFSLRALEKVKKTYKIIKNNTNRSDLSPYSSDDWGNPGTPPFNNKCVLFIWFARMISSQLLCLRTTVAIYKMNTSSYTWIWDKQQFF